LTVQGADIAFSPLPSEVGFTGVGEGAAKKLVLRDTCDGEYGVNVFGTGRMLVRNSVARGLSDAGLTSAGSRMARSPWPATRPSPATGASSWRTPCRDP
jgi:hypothetical protein